MPRRLLLDGEDLGALMQRVRAEMGPDAVVVKAERVRTGGVAGFFAKERFELTVEVPDPRPGRRSVPTPAGPVGMSALLDAADAADGAATPAVGAAPRPPADASVAGPPTPRLSTDGDTFATLLASIDDMAQGHPPAAGPAGAVADTSTPPPARITRQGAAVTPATFPQLGSGAAAAPPAPAAPASSAAPAAPAAPPSSAALPAPTALPAPAAPSAPGAPPASGAPPAPGAAPSEGGSTRGALARLGVPASLLGAGPGDEPLALSAVVGALPRPPALVRTPGALVAVVGEGSSALAVATGLAQRARLLPHDVVLAGDLPSVQGHGRRLLTPAAAARHRAKVAAGDAVSIVAVGVGPEAEDRSAAVALLAELAADQVWAVVDARRKTPDLRAWLEALTPAGAVDAVAALRVHDTQEPGTVLDLDAPVAWIDGLPATPVVWAAVLSERLDPAARWD